MKTMKTWKIEDASQLALENPTTFFTPSPEEIKSLSPGDNVKLIFYPTDPEESCGERMWVEVESANDGKFTGFLNNIPNIKGLEFGDTIEFEGKNIIYVDTNRLDRSEPYFKWCLVTNRVLEDKEKPRYIFWAPSEDEDDSGWSITAGDENEEYLNDPSNSQRVPLGEAVYHDDSFKHLLFLEKETAYFFDEGQLWVEVDNDQP